MINPTYRVMEVAAPGTLRLAERNTPTPQAGEVLIAVEACRMCGADVGDIERSEVKPRIETMRFERANDAYHRLKSGRAAFRIVLTTGRQ